MTACKRSCCCHFDQERFSTYFDRFVHMEPMSVVMQSFAAVRSVFLWAQLNGDPLQALLNILGVDVDVHPRVLADLSDGIGVMQSRSLHVPSLRRRLKSQNGGGQGGGSLDSYWLTCYKQVLIAPASAIMEVRSIRGLFCLRLRAFGDGFVLVGRFRIIMLYFAYAVYESFYFFVYFSGSVDAFRLWDPGGNSNWRSSRMARGSTSSHQ